METRISSAKKEVIIGDDRPTVLIGERINPTGKKKLAESLVAGNLDIVRAMALAQAEAGADILDINVGTAGVNEISLLPQAVQVVMETVDLPLCIDTTDIEALEAALKVYHGKALINSVTGEEGSLAAVLPVVKRYGAAVIALAQGDAGIPKDVEQRVANARKIIERAEKLGVPSEDIIIDSLAFTLGAEPESGLIVLEAIQRIKSELGVNQTLGASNVSFGLPDRELLNNAFLAVAIASGVNCPIVDVAKMRPIVLATDLVLNCDNYAQRYIKGYRQRSSH